MRRILGKTFLLGLLAAVAACSGGSSGNVVTRAGNFQVALCSLGCQGGSCAVNQIATNQDIVFTFNDAVDPATVSFTTISVVEISNGSTPAGEFVVDGRKVIFRPSLIENEAGIQFGFQEGSIYRVTVFASPESNVVKSVIGRPNLTPITCSIETSGIIDLVPGRPRVDFTPNASSPPSSNDFDIEMVFNDLMQKDQLVDANTGESPSVTVSVVDDSQSSTVEVQVPGTYTIEFDQNLLLTTLNFHPLTPFPSGMNGLRKLRIDFSSQIADIADNFLSNPGSNLVALPTTSASPGSFLESFNDTAQLDSEASTAGLWADTPGALASGYDPVTGVHRGGGTGILGSFEPTEDFSFNTDSMEMVTLTAETTTITGGVFMFERIHIPAGVTVTAAGPNPLRLFCRGECVIEGTLDLSGAPAPANFGKYFPRFDERISDPQSGEGESTGGIFEFEAEGGAPAAGNGGGGSGGRGGVAWYLLDGGAAIDYYDEDKTSWVEGQSGPPDPDPTRYLQADLGAGNPFLQGRWPNVHGQPGEGVGAAATGGDPEVNFAQLAGERALGAGMGSWAWPPLTDSVPDLALTTQTPIRSHYDSVGAAWTEYAWHRARGGGGGGYWTVGSQGDYFVAGSTDPLLRLLEAPVIDAPNGVWEYNSFLDIDARAGGGTPDAAGGDYTLPAGIETLDPSLGLLLGGAGGGGAGTGLHGSYWDGGNFQIDGLIDTYRNCSGAGGGAGGAALQLHSGGRLAISGAVTVAGGSGGDSEFMLTLPYHDSDAIDWAPPGDAGGGGGSGGAILLQTNSSLTVSADALLLSGGRGGKGSAGNHGGAGGAGLIRFETPTGSEPLVTLQGMVSPDESVELTPIGQPGVANVAAFEGDLGGTLGDFKVFNGNASGVRSSWMVPANDVLLLDFTGYTITVRYDDGTEQVVTYDGDDLSANDHTAPGTTPVWVAFQVGWGAPGTTEPQASTLGDWVVPGYESTTGGLPELRGNLARMVRFMVVFDHDLISALIGAGAGRYYQVEDITLNWNGE